MDDSHAVIFDLDDTLYPERAFAFSGFAAVAEQFVDVLGEPAESVTAMRRLFDTEHRPRVFNALLAERGIEPDPAIIDRMIATYRAHRPAIELYPDADALLHRLRPDYRLGLLTDGPPVTQRNKIEALALPTRIDEIIITSTLDPPKPKPDPTAFLLLAQRLGASGDECVYVADNPAKDFLAPNALGWRTVRVVRPDGVYRDTPTAPGGEPQFVVHDLTALGPILSI